MIRIPMPRVDYELIRLGGGLDQITPTLSLPPGAVRRGANFECALSGGYTRIAGYERADGHPSPSLATYGTLTVALTDTVAVGAIVAGASSGATAKVIAITGSRVTITRRLGAFVDGETITVSGIAVGTVTSQEGIASDGLLDAQLRYLAADDYRADIAAVPGEGSILGVTQLNGVLYAWRNAVGGASANIFRSTPSGWQQVALPRKITFTAGIAEIAVGVVVGGGTSAATGTVIHVSITSGGWATTDAAGYIYIMPLTGVFVSGESLQVLSVNKATASSAAIPVVILPNGRFRTKVANFGGGAANRRIYGCDGVNQGFEFDGTNYIPIMTGMVPDVPNRVAVHKQHLFFSFKNSLQNSAIADPFDWTPLLGASEQAMNSDITILLPLPGDQTSGAMAVYTDTDTSILYGTSTADFALSTFNTGTGARSDSGQTLDQCYALSNRGILKLSATLNFGNFAGTALTDNLIGFIKSRLPLTVDSTVSRDRGQYRVFFSDGYALYMTMKNGKYVGTMPVQYPNPATCVCEGVTASGEETSYFGSTNGFVYQIDAGTSFDGEEIQANMTLAYNSIRAPRINKTYRAASLEITGDGYAEFAFGYDIGYTAPYIAQASDVNETADLRSAYWDSLVWDDFVFDGQELSPTECEMNGTAENVAIRISSVSNLLKPFTVNSVIIHYSPRRGLRQ